MSIATRTAGPNSPAAWRAVPPAGAMDRPLAVPPVVVIDLARVLDRFRELRGLLPWTDVRYDVQYYKATGDDSSKAFGDAALTPRVHMAGDGRWCPLDLYADNTLPINTTLFGYRLRVAAFGWKQGSERVYGKWSYAAIAGTASSPGAGVPQKP